MFVSIEEIIRKLEIIRVCGDKGTIWNFEAGMILDYIKDLKRENAKSEVKDE